jgi:hypothetical protein
MNNWDRHRDSDDPLKTVREDAPAFNRAWLKAGESMPLVQRIGFTAISLFSCLIGLFMLKDSLLRFRSDDASFVFSGLFSVACLFFGYIGLKNVLRFKHKAR